MTKLKKYITFDSYMKEDTIDFDNEYPYIEEEFNKDTII